MVEVKFQTDDGTFRVLANQMAELPDECLGIASFFASNVVAQRIIDAYRKRGGWAIAWWNGMRSNADPAGYKIDSFYDNGAHIVLRSKRIGFMSDINDSNVLYELTRKHVTTPIISEWVPQIRKIMARKGLIQAIKPPRSYGCKPGVISFTNEQLDEIVQQRLADGSFSIQQEKQ